VAGSAVFQPAIILAQILACVLSTIPGNCRRSSTAPASSPPRSKAARIAAASASVTTNISVTIHDAAGRCPASQDAATKSLLAPWNRPDPPNRRGATLFRCLAYTRPGCRPPVTPGFGSTLSGNACAIRVALYPRLCSTFSAFGRAPAAPCPHRIGAAFCRRCTALGRRDRAAGVDAATDRGTLGAGGAPSGAPAALHGGLTAYGWLSVPSRHGEAARRRGVRCRG
jgi:hypothetical protein